VTKISVASFNRLLESWAAQTPPILYFSVENVLEALKLDHSYYDQVLKLLMSRNGFELKAEKMGLCPSNHKLQAFPLDEEVDDYFECYCQPEEFEVLKFKLVFSFDKEFILDSLKKKTKMRTMEGLILI
jgi:hypothetical protein